MSDSIFWKVLDSDIEDEIQMNADILLPLMDGGYHLEKHWRYEIIRINIKLKMKRSMTHAKK